MPEANYRPASWLGPAPRDEPTLLDYLRIMQRRLRVILVTLLVAAAAALAAVLLIQPLYEAEATGLLPPKQGSGAGGLAALASASGLAQMLPITMGLGGGATAADFQAVLESRRITDQLIDKLKLDASPDFAGWRNRDQLRGWVRKRLRVTQPTAKVSLFKISARSVDAERAAAMANTWMDLMLRYLDQSNYRQASKHRRFLERELGESRKRMAKSEQQLATFQQANRTVSVSDEARMYIERYARVEADLLAARALQSENTARLRATGEKLTGLQSGLSTAVTQLEIEQRGLGSRQQELDRARNDYMRALTGLPAKALELARLEREVKVQNALYLYLVQQLASARLDEDKDVDLLLPLDRAEAPAGPVFPNRRLILALAILGGLLVGVLLALLAEYLAAARDTSTTELPEDVERRLRTLTAD